MGYQTEIQRDLPYAFFSMDTFTNKVAPLVRGGGNAAHIVNGSPATFSFPGFVSTRFPKPLAMEFWFKHVKGDSTNTLLGHAEGDGVLYEGYTRTLTFRLKLTTGDAEVSILVPENKTHHVVAVIDKTEMSLYLDGELVGTRVFTIEEQQTGFAGIADETQLVSSTSTDNEHIIDAVAFYTSVVKPDMMKRHFEAGQNVSEIMSAVSQFGGHTIELNRSNFNFVDQKTFQGDTWEDGMLNFVNYSSGVLRPDETTGLWSGSLPINDPVDAVMFDWEELGQPDFIIKPTDELLVNGSSITVDPEQEWHLDISLPNSYNEISRLFIGAIKDAYIEASGGSRRAKISGWVSDRLFYPLHNRDSIGAEAPVVIERDLGDESVTLEDAAEGDPIVVPARPAEKTGSVEFWIKIDSPATILDNGTNSITWNGSAWAKDAGSTVYTNGVSGFGGLKVGQWTHVVTTMTPTDAAITIGSNGKVGMINLYERQLTAGEIATIYDTYFGKAGLSVSDSGSIAVTESASPWELYAHEWSIISAGG